MVVIGMRVCMCVHIKIEKFVVITEKENITAKVGSHH